MRRIIQKTWGLAIELYRDQVIELVRIEVEPGGYSSRHFHRNKDNLFQVVVGLLTIRLYEAGLCREIVLGPRQEPFLVLAGVEHQFIAPAGPAVAFETYLALPGSSIDPGDIIRLGEGQPTEIEVEAS